MFSQRNRDLHKAIVDNYDEVIRPRRGTETRAQESSRPGGIKRRYAADSSCWSWTTELYSLLDRGAVIDQANTGQSPLSWRVQASDTAELLKCEVRICFSSR